MTSTKQLHVDLLVDGEEDELLNVSLSMGDICLQWRALPTHGLTAMREALISPPGTAPEIKVGTLFGVALYLVEREGIFSFKAMTQDGGSDQLRIDVPAQAVPVLADELADAIESWEG